MTKEYCSPNNKDNSFTCFSNKSLIKLAKQYNLNNNDKINIPKSLDKEQARKQLWKDIDNKTKKYVDNNCNGDHCLLDTKLVKNLNDSELVESFRPIMPKEWVRNKNQWLSTVDIEKVMSQYEKKTDNNLKDLQQIIEALLFASPEPLTQKRVNSVFEDNPPNLEYYVKKINNNIFTKSGLMVGLGENKDEILQVMDDLRSAEVDFLTIGQYLQPSIKHHPLNRYYIPEEFKELEKIAKLKGFLLVSSSPLTRSSYHADEDFAKLQKNRLKQTNAQSIS